MAILKCKMCGGDLKVNLGDTVCTCDYCGTQQTLPRLDSEKKANLYDRANHFRRNNDFDKAMGIYEKILDEDNTDSEAYWSLVLCRYGIEYVEDPATHKRVPTINRAQYTSIYADENYKSAIRCANTLQKDVYESEAKVIDEIQKEILEISSKEEPFDVFICYKETDESGRRTPDSVLANDLYHQLIQEGFKVFFARITLEDKLGQEYEPYIFAALNSAKVMVVLGTKPEYFKAIWVKNEWSRFLGLIRGGAKKTLIPAYKDMDPYDLPEEFSHLQAQDMTKLGFMQDLIRGINKIIEVDQVQIVAKETAVVQQGVRNSNVIALLKRGKMALEDEEWDKADRFFEDVLNQDAENGEAFFGKLLIQNKCSNAEQLKQKYFEKYENASEKHTYSACNVDIEYINRQVQEKQVSGYFEEKEIREIYDYDLKYESDVETRRKQKEKQKSELATDKLFNRCRQYATGETKEKIDDILVSLDEVLENRIQEAESQDEKKIDKIRTEYKLFIKNTADIKVQKLYEKAVETREEDYQKIVKEFELAEDLFAYKGAKSEFLDLKGYKDALEFVKRCDVEIERIKKEEKEAQERNRLEVIKAKALDMKKREKRKKIITVSIIVVPIVLIMIRVVVVNVNLINTYNHALKLKSEGDYLAAYEEFESISGYKDSDTQMSDVTMIKGILGSSKIGDIIDFGDYEGNTKWQVLAKEENKMLIISKDCIYETKYDYKSEGTTWETCTLRTWLNRSYYNSAFNDIEKEVIIKTDVINNENVSYGTSGGNNTQDKVFLLSIEEAEKYFQENVEREASYNGELAWWWLRSPGESDINAADIDCRGAVSSRGYRVYYEKGGVRPALWISID